MTALIPQAARDAAADFTEAVGGDGYSAGHHWLYRSGAADQSALVQAFAKAIADEQERCARVARDKALAWARTASDYNYDRVREAAAYEIEASIRGSNS